VIIGAPHDRSLDLRAARRATSRICAGRTGASTAATFATTRANDGKTLVLVNLAEIAHKPKPATARSSDDDRAAVTVLAAKLEALRADLATWSPRDDHVAMAVLKAQVGTLHAELIKAEAVAADHRANFAAERSRCDALIAELLKATADLMASKEAAARLDGELAELRARRWWRRLAG